MRVGDILLEHGWVDEDSLARAVVEQPRSGLRLCSLLVERGAVGFDHAARALGEQLESACVLQRHLEHRDRSLAALLPAEFARSAIALPIGRMGNGAVIICVREPSAGLQAEITRVLSEPFILAVTPARRLERLVDHTYRELDIDIEVEMPPAPEPDVDFDIDVEVVKPPPPRTSPRQTRPAIVIPTAAIQAAASPGSHPASSGSTLEGTIARFGDIDTLDWLFDVVMAFVAKRWTSSLLLAIHDGAARGQLGHGGTVTKQTIAALTVPLSAPSLVQLAHERRRVVDGDGAGHAELATVLGEPQRPAAAVLTDGDAVTHVLIVGDPRGDDPDDATVDLARLAEAVDEALSRLRA